MQVMQDQSLARRKTDAEIPLLPCDPVPFYRKARTLGLRDLDLLEVAAHLRNIFRQVVACTLRYRNDAEIIDPDDLHSIQVKHGMKPCNWMSIRIFFRIISL